MKRVLLSILAGATMLVVQAQCPSVTCPGNITVGNDFNVCGATINYNVIAQDTCGSGSQTFTHTGGVQFFVVPAGIFQVNINASGAQGGANAQSVAGGLGGDASGDLSVTPGDTLWVYVGGTAGFNGGGQAGTSGTCTQATGGTGGGASDVRVGGQALTNRVIVAGGGGGAGGNRVQGCARGGGGGGGGGYYGGGGGPAWPQNGTMAGGGTQTAGGAGGTSTYTTAAPANNGAAGVIGVGGNGGIELNSNQAGSNTAGSGGTGGGATGGAGVYTGNFTGGSGGGGSSYIGGVTNGVTNSGTQTGDGVVTISYSNPVTLTQTMGLPSGSIFPVGTTTNEFVVSGSGPGDTCSFTITVIDSGQVTTLGALSQDTICTSSGTMTLPAGTPAGGTYSGTGVTGNTFDPAAAERGDHWIYYTDTVGCQNTDSVLITVVWCTGIEEGALSDIVTIAPNPSNGVFQLSIPQGEHFEKLELYDASGRKVWTAIDPRNTTELDLTNNADGLYMLHVGMNGQQQVFRLLKK